jgi:hypothetical protein
MILRLLKGRGMVSGLFEKKLDAIPPHPAPPKALILPINMIRGRDYLVLLDPTEQQSSASPP